MSRFRQASLLIAVVLLCVVSLPARLAAQTYLIDTGPGSSSPGSYTALISAGSTTCSPQPSCSQAFQYLAAQFTLTQAATVDTIEAWMGTSGSVGSLQVKIRADTNGLPSTEAPRVLRPGSLFTRTYQMPGSFGPRWVSFAGYGAVLAAGTYWVTFEPVAGTGLSTTMPDGAPNPLAKYAFFANGNNRWVALSNRQLGVRILGTPFPGSAFGTAVRYTQGGELFDCCHYERDMIRGGEGQPLTRTGLIVAPGGAITTGRAKLPEATSAVPPSPLQVGAYSSSSDSFVGAARAVAYRTFMNVSDQAKTFRINGVLDGVFSRNGGTATAGVYALTSAGFSNAINASGVGSAVFLLQRDDLTRLRSGSDTLTLSTLFPPAARLASEFESVIFGLDTPGVTNLSTNFITVQPGATFVLMFDVSVSSRVNGFANFEDTLKPAANLFTDTSGNPVYEVIAVGPPTPASSPATSLTLAPASAATAVGTVQTVTVTATTAAGLAAPEQLVTFTVTSGPNAGTVATIATDTDGAASFSFSSTTVGTDVIQASIGDLQSNQIQNTWQAGAINRIAITPVNASIAAGASQAYVVDAFDTFENRIGDVTASTAFSIAPDGTCVGATCTAATPGPHTVTASVGGKTATATLTIESAPVCATNVSSQVNVVRGGYRLNRATGTFAQTVTLTNTSGTPLVEGAFVLDGLSANATLQNPGGITSCAAPSGSPYVVLPTMAPGQTVTLTLQFQNPTQGAIGYQLRVLAGSVTR